MGLLESALRDPGERDELSAAPVDHRALRALHLDLLGRPPFERERGRWLGSPRAELVDALLSSLEQWERWLDDELYYFLLIDNFRPEAEGVRSIPRELHEGRLDVRSAIHRIALSSNFDHRNPGADTFVTVVMEQLLGIEVQRAARELEIGKRVYDGHPGTFLGARGASQADVVRIAIADERFLRRFLTRQHVRLLRAEPERRPLAAWCRELEEDPAAFPDLVRRWLLSEGYAARLASRAELGNRTFVRALFVDLFDRLPEPEDVRRLSGALDGLGDPGPLRSTIARILLDSGGVPLPGREQVEDPRTWIASLFPRFLGREAEPEELAGFLEAFAEPACRTETVVYAIVSDPEYAES